jgi:hypothetical protein
MSLPCIRQVEGSNEKYLLAAANIEQIKRILHRAWDTNEFRSEYGLRSLSKVYL